MMNTFRLFYVTPRDLLRLRIGIDYVAKGNKTFGFILSS